MFGIKHLLSYRRRQHRIYIYKADVFYIDIASWNSSWTQAWDRDITTSSNFIFIFSSSYEIIAVFLSDGKIIE